MSYTYYHNPRCSKSRQGLEILEEKNIEFQIKEYLKDGLENKEVQNILSNLIGDKASLVRIKETLFKEKGYQKSDLESESNILKMLTENPKLLERPLLVSPKKAIIGRPPEKLLEIL